MPLPTGVEERQCAYVHPDKDEQGRGGQRCGQWATPGKERCRFHGEYRTAVNLSRDRALLMVERAAADLDLPVAVKPEDFKKVCAEYVARFSRLYARLEADLDTIREMGFDEVLVARAYADILDRQATTAVLVTKMMDSAAKLGLGVEDPPDPQAEVDLLLASLAESRARSDLI